VHRVLAMLRPVRNESFLWAVAGNKAC
jgi:hypothetical protein